MNIKTISIISGAVLCLAFYIGKVTADTIEENNRHEVTQEAVRHLEDYFLFQEKMNQARDSHYLMRQLIEENCRLVGQEYDNCKYLPKDLRDKFERFDRNFQASRSIEKLVEVGRNTEVTTQVASCGEVIKKGWSKEASYWVQQAYNISGCDKNFVYLLEAENGKWDHTRVGVTGDIGFCQIAPQWHPDIVNNDNFYVPEWQLAKCYELYKGGTRFYGKDNIWRIKENIIFS